MEEVRQDAAETTVEEGSEENGGRQDRTWFPYITKVQFERFLSRLESKIPDQIDRDYVRPIIRTPSMLHRFLRGIESMNLTDRNQKPTDLLLRLVPQETRRFAIADVIRDLYKELLPEWEQSNGNMSDDAIVDYFRNRTGMGRDSANKMKMFFKYLIAEADFGDPSEPQEEAAAPNPRPKTNVPKLPNPRPKRIAVPANPRPKRIAVPANPRPKRIAVPANPRPKRIAVPANPRPKRIAVPANPRPRSVPDATDAPSAPTPNARNAKSASRSVPSRSAPSRSAPNRSAP